jgi:hypothetical protein
LREDVKRDDGLVAGFDFGDERSFQTLAQELGPSPADIRLASSMGQRRK